MKLKYSLINNDCTLFIDVPDDSLFVTGNCITVLPLYDGGKKRGRNCKKKIMKNIAGEPYIVWNKECIFLNEPDFVPLENLTEKLNEISVQDFFLSLFFDSRIVLTKEYSILYNGKKAIEEVSFGIDCSNLKLSSIDETNACIKLIGRSKYIDAIFYEEYYCRDLLNLVRAGIFKIRNIGEMPNISVKYLDEKNNKWNKFRSLFKGLFAKDSN